MICGNNYLIKPFVIVKYETRIRKPKMYYFVGKISGDIEKIMKKVINHKKPTETEMKKIEKHFGKKYAKNYVNEALKSKKVEIELIEDRIYLDDNITQIRRKLFVYLSDISKKDYLHEKNQELYVKNPLYCDNKYNLLGFQYQYEDKKGNLNDLNIQPSIKNKKIKPDYKYFVDADGTRKKLNLVKDNGLLFINYINIYHFENEPIIYVNNLQDEKKFLEQKGQLISDKKIINGYLRKYWPYLDIKIEKNNFKKMNRLVKHGKMVNNFLNKLEINKENYSQCNILNLIIQLNYGKQQYYKFIDLWRVFESINLNNKTVFKKYREPNLPNIYSFVYNKLIEDKTITPKILNNWISTNDIFDTEIITFQRFLFKTSDNENIYYSLKLFNDGRCQIKLKVPQKLHANIDFLKVLVKDIKSFIDELNEMEYQKESRFSKMKITSPDIKIDKNIIYISNNLTINFMGFNFGYILKNYANDYALMKSIGESFIEYISPLLSSGKHINKSLYKFKYNRIDNFKNYTEIFLNIKKMFQSHEDDASIVKMIENKYNKDHKEAIQIYEDWKNLLHGYNLKQGRQTGIDILIENNFTNVSSLKYHTFPTKNENWNYLYLFQSQSVFEFVSKFLHIIDNYDKYIKNKEFIKILKTDKNLQNIQEETFSFESALKPKSSASIKYNNAIVDELINEIDFNELNNNINVSLKGNQNITNEDSFNSSNIINQLSNQIEYDHDAIDPNIKLDCDGHVNEINYAIDTCTDICKDINYKIRRLQNPRTGDNLLYKAQKDSSFSYAKSVQGNKQPIVMTSDPAKNPLIKEGSYTYALKYKGSLNKDRWYICPRAWCPTCQIPLRIDEIRDIQKRHHGQRGLCDVGKCPYGNHDVFIFDKTKNSSKFPQYPGFQEKTKHPDGYCLVGCFKKPKNNPKSSKYKYFLDCLGEDSTNIINNRKSGYFYILDASKNPSDGRFSNLPVIIQKLFRKKCDVSTLKKNESCYLRRGIPQTNQSFIEAIKFIVYDARNSKPLSLQIFKHKILQNLDEETFYQLQNGYLGIIFDIPHAKDNAYELYKKYFMEKNSYIDERIAWELMSWPGILAKDGLNIFIVKNNKIVCPNNYLYSNDKPSLFIYKHNKREYEPILYVKNQKQNPLTGVLDTSKIFIQNIMKLIKEKCTIADQIRWTNINSSDKQITISELKKEFKITHQVLDKFKQLIGVIINEIYIPVYPYRKLTKIPILTSIPKMNYKTIGRKLDAINKKLHNKLIISSKIVQDNYIVGVVLTNGRIIPVTKIKNVKNKLPNSNLSYYNNINNLIYNNHNIQDIRKEQLYKLNYQIESYERLRFEIAKIIQDNKLYKIIKKVINDEKSKLVKRKKITNIIKRIVKLFYSPVKKELSMNDIKNIPNIRRTCTTLNSCNDLFCIQHKKKCYYYFDHKLFYNPKFTLNTFITMIVEDIINNPFKRKIILADKIDFVINRAKFTQKKNETMIIGSGKDIKQFIRELFNPKSNLDIDLNKRYNTIRKDKLTNQLINKIYNKNIKNRSLVKSNIIQDNYELIDLPELWENRLSKLSNSKSSLKIVSMDYSKRSLFNIFIWLESRIDNKLIKDKLGVTRKEMSGNLINYMKKIKPNKLKFIIKKLSIHKEFSRLKELLNGDDDNLLIKMYQKLYPEEFVNIPNIEEFSRLFKSIRYSNNLLDCVFLSDYLELNMFVFDKRITKENPKGFTPIILFETKPLMVLFKENRKAYTFFQLCIKKYKSSNNKGNHSDCSYFFSNINKFISALI